VKYAKIMSLAAVAAVAIMALVGAGSASATTMCKKNESPCSSANQWPSGTKFTAVSSEALLTGSLEVHCASTIELTTNATSGSPLAGTVNALKWTSCGGGCTSATTTTLPSGSLEASSGGNGTMTAEGAVVELKPCLGFFTCVATASNASLAFTGGSGGSEAADAKATASNVPVSISGFGCGTSGTWNAGGGSGGSAYVVKTAKTPTETAVSNPPVFASKSP
jgi:hypothetical protein